MNANGGPQQNMEQMDFMNQQRLTNGGAGASHGSHALQDYQMQLMLLEQQNKKRLLMARQEQENINLVPQGSAPGGQIAYAPAMSPSGSRAGPSPNPNDQMKRVAGTPKMGQGVIPGSPMPEMQNRGSPAPGFEAPVPQGVRSGQFFNNGMGGNPAMMGGQQPPSSHPGGFNNMQMQNMNPQVMEQMRMASGGRFPNGQPFQQQPPQMMQGNQPQQVGTPQQRNTMPPPPAPSQEQQRTQPSSPAQPQAPPTPSTAPKSAPKGKKETAPKKVRTKCWYLDLSISANFDSRKLHQRRVVPLPRRQSQIPANRRRRQRRQRLLLPCIKRRSTTRTANHPTLSRTKCRLHHSMH
jgi:hypothetical protein